MWLPTACCAFLELLHDLRPNHSLMAADFDRLPDVRLPGRNAPLVAEKVGACTMAFRVALGAACRKMLGRLGSNAALMAEEVGVRAGACGDECGGYMVATCLCLAAVLYSALRHARTMGLCATRRWWGRRRA